MRSGFRTAGSVVALAALVSGAACSDNPKTGSDKFVGAWVYAGVINGNCGGQPVSPPLDLTGYSTTITATDMAHITVQLGTACTVKFDVDAFVATAQANQSCTFDLGGTLGQQMVAIKKWTLTSTGVDSITSDFSGTALICTAAGTGTLTRTGDAGATD
jgi:hypothetical protein